MREQDLINQKQAAAILGRSISAVSRAVKEGRLDYADPKRRLFSRPGLEVRYANHTRRRVDQPMVKTQKLNVRHAGNLTIQEPEPERAIPTDFWGRLTQKLEIVLEGAPAYWSEAPDAQRLKLFCRMLDELRSQVEAEGMTV